MVNGVNPAAVGNAARARIDSNDSSRGSVSSQSPFGSVASSISASTLSSAGSQVVPGAARPTVRWADQVQGRGGQLENIHTIPARTPEQEARSYARSQARQERVSVRAEVQAPQAQANVRSSQSLDAHFQSSEASGAPPSRPARSTD